MKAQLGLALVLLLSCSDPVKDNLVASLGPEKPGESPGPLHRAGQPCGACHDGGKAHQFTVAGTVFATQGLLDPAPGITVEIDDLGTGKALCSATTNSVGNFYMTPADCSPVSPFKPKLILADPTAMPVQMITRVAREVSCATCHKGTTPTSSSVEGVYVAAGGM